MDVARFIARRVGSGLVVMILIVTIIFFVLRMSGDPAAGLLGDDATAEALAQFRSRYGLDQPLWRQWITYMGNAFQGDFGQSFRYSDPAMPIVLDRLPATLKLGGVGLLFALVFALPIGILSALRPGTWIDNISRVVAVVGQSVPIFWLGILLILTFSIRFPIFPAVGAGSWKHLVLPGVALAAYSVPITMRLVRSSMLEVLHQEYIKTARSKGLSERRITVNHALRNALVPVITIIGLRIGSIVGGAVVLEEVFAYPGMGRLALDSMRQLDYAVVQSFAVVVAAIVVAVNLLIDVLYGVIDPRIRVS